MGCRILESDLCNPDKWTDEEIKRYQNGRKKELTPAYLIKDLPSNQPWHKTYYLNSIREIWSNDILEEKIIEIAKVRGKPEALIALEEEVTKIY